MDPAAPRPSAIAVILAPAVLWFGAGLVGGPAFGFDTAVLAVLHPDAPGGWSAAAWYLTWLGDWVVLIPVAAAGAAFLLWRGRWRDAGVLVLTVTAVRVLVGLQKHVAGRARPDVAHYMAETSFSFPSGHAANSAATYLLLALLLTRSRAGPSLALILVLSIGVSRVVLGVHWPSDVIGGWAFGALAVAAADMARAPVRSSAANGESAHSG